MLGGFFSRIRGIFSDKKKAVYYTALLFVMLFGVFLRINAYLMNSSMWYDEVSLALNVRENIFLPPLLNNQSAPFLFLILAKICSVFSHSNFSYRFIPFVSGIFSIPVFYIFAKNFIKSKLGLLLAMFIFCINFRLIYFSREFKPYAVDVLVFMLAAICFFRLFSKSAGFNKLTNLKSASFGTGLALLPLLSFPSLFVLPVYFLAALLKIKEEYKKVLAFLAPSAIFLPIYYFSVLSKYSTNEYLLDFWEKGFISLKTIGPVFIHILDFFQEPLFANLFFILATILGFIICIKQEKKTLFLVGVLAFVVLASILHKYPMRERLILFLYPMFLVFVFKIFDMKIFKTGLKNILLTLLMFILAFGANIKATLKADFNENFYCMEAIEGLLNVLKHEHKDDEYIFPLPWSDVAFMHYNEVYKFPKKDIVIFKDNRSRDYTRPFWGIPKGKYWLIFTIRPDNYYRHVSLQEWLERDFKIIKIYQDHSSRMYYVEKVR